MNDCPQGIKNEKDIERLTERFTIMFEHLTEGMDKLDKKLDQLEEKMNGRMDTIDSKIDNLSKSIPDRVKHTVNEELHSGVYSVFKFILVTAAVAAIGVTVKLVIGA